MFFRPEENAFLSKGLDDVRILKAAKIDIGDKDNGTAIRFLTAAIHIPIDLHLHGSLAVGAFRLNLNDHVLLPQPPLHEGRRESVHRSGGIKPLPRGKGYSVRGFFNRHGIGPDDSSLFVPNQKSQVFFQILQIVLNLLQG